MTNIKEAWKHKIEDTNLFQQFDDDSIQNTHYVLMCVWKSGEMRNTISCQEWGKGIIFPTIVEVECDDFSIKKILTSVLNQIKTSET